MTNEEAKQELINLCYDCNYSYGTECMGDVACLEAKRTAIKALEQEPCKDAISRQAAVYVASGFCHPANVADELAKLPPVNPQPKTDALDKISTEIEQYEADCMFADTSKECKECDRVMFGTIYRIIDKYKKKSEGAE